jgi:hypothetical protein
MKLQLNTTDKTVTLEEAVKVGDLTDILEKLLPGEWKTYTIKTNTTFNWGNPIIIREYPQYPSYPYWWTSPIYSNGETSISYTASDGIFNLQLP